MKKPPDKPKPKNASSIGLRKNQLSDAELWEIYSSKITPLNVNKRNLNTGSFKEAYFDKPPPVSRPQRVKAPSKPTFTVPVPAKPFDHGKADGLDRVSQKNMRRGKITIEARLDLHGMIQAEAHTHLLGFLERAYLAGKRSVLVITGKGVTRHGEIGVLRRAVPKWLNEPPVKNWIRGFDYAAPADGGEGALYILLRRKR